MMGASAIFGYLIKKHEFKQLPADADDDLFADKLLRSANDTTELLRFFGTYAFVADAFKKANCDLIYVKIPKAVPRIPVSTTAFTETELRTISQYEPTMLL
jgi:hypothetical protein